MQRQSVQGYTETTFEFDLGVAGSDRAIQEQSAAMDTDLPTNTVSATWSGPVQTPQACPDTAEIVIIGGGIVGVSTAWFLARQGVDVALCEKGFIAGEQSGRNWGWVRIQGRDPREVPMMLESLKIWRSLAEVLGEDVGFTEGGCLYTARTDKALAEYAQWLEVAREYKLGTRVISGGDLRACVGDAASQWVGALYTPDDGRAEPHKATPALARAALRAGASILSGCAVRGIETESGAISAVVTEHGSIRTSCVLCAAGAWSSLFCRSLGINLPQLKVRGTVARTAPASAVLNGNLFDDRIGIRRRQDGGFTVAHGSILEHGVTPSTFRFAFKFLPALMKESRALRLSLGSDFFDELRLPTRWSLDEKTPFEAHRVLDPPPNPKVLAGLRRNMTQTFPELANVSIVESWAGMVETTPDVVPVICAVEKLPGFHIATGFSGHGFGLGPGAGKAIAAMLTGRDVGVDLSPFRLGRFFDGSPIQINASI